MSFRHDDAVWRAFPGLSAAAFVTRVDAGSATDEVAERTDALVGVARARLAGATEGELPEIRAWRRAYSAMGLKPTQYRCAAEALLRRLRRDGALPRLHPLVDLCNAASAAYAIPVAVLDLDRIDGDLTVRPALGSENYETFGGEHEHPEPAEIIYADSGGRAHSRRWCTRQSGRSATRPDTTRALIVAEAQHESGPTDVAALLAELSETTTLGWGSPLVSALLSVDSPTLEIPA